MRLNHVIYFAHILFFADIALCIFFSYFKKRNENLKYFINLALTLICILIPFVCKNLPSYHEDFIAFFFLPTLVSPIILLSMKNKLLKDLLFSITIIAACAYSAVFFWDYMDNYLNKFDSANDWFSFENELDIIVFPILGLFSIMTGILLRLFISSLQKFYGRFLKK